MNGPEPEPAPRLWPSWLHLLRHIRQAVHRRATTSERSAAFPTDVTSQSELSSNNGQATKTSKEPVYWSPYPGWEVPQSWGPGFRGEALLPLRALREAAQRVTRKGNDRHGIPRCGARRRSFDHPAPMAQASSCSSTPAFKSLPRSRARISVPRSELA